MSGFAPVSGTASQRPGSVTGNKAETDGRQQAIAGKIARHIRARHAAGRATARKQIGKFRAVVPHHPGLIIDHQPTLGMEEGPGHFDRMERRDQGRFAGKIPAKGIRSFTGLIGRDLGQRRLQRRHRRREQPPSLVTLSLLCQQIPFA